VDVDGVVWERRVLGRAHSRESALHGGKGAYGVISETSVQTEYAGGCTGGVCGAMARRERGRRGDVAGSVN
jgi:hypothetical protein